MKIFVCSPVAGRGIKKISSVQSLLRKAGFEVLNQLKMDYSSTKDFRGKKKLAEKIVSNDLKLIREADVVIAVADEPSFGVGGELLYAKQLKKTVMLFLTREIASPWPIALSDVIVSTTQELIVRLRGVKKRYR